MCFLKLWHKIVFKHTKEFKMDTVINRKSNKKKYLAIAVLAIVVLGYGAFSMITKKRTFNVKKSEITIKSVEEDYFEDFSPTSRILKEYALAPSPSPRYMYTNNKPKMISRTSCFVNFVQSSVGQVVIACNHDYLNSP